MVTMRKLVSVVACWLALNVPAGAQDIVGGTPTKSFRAVGIGVQVAPDWVMTVRHAVIGPGGTYENGYGMRTVAEVYVPDTADFPANDFALLRLVPAAAPVLGAVYPAVGTRAIKQGVFPAMAATVVSIANHDPRGVALTTVTESIPVYDDDGPGPLPAVDVNWLVSWDPNVHLQNGDSGGGLFQGHVRDSSVLIGLSSALLPMDDGRLGSAFVQPAAYRAWIDSIMNADLHDEQRLQWIDLASPVPEPAAWALLLAGGVLLPLVRRR